MRDISRKCVIEIKPRSHVLKSQLIRHVSLKARFCISVFQQIESSLLTL